MANPQIAQHYKRVHEKRLVLVDACAEFQRAASTLHRSSPFWPSLSSEERIALDYLEEALREFNLTRTGDENG